MEFKFTDENFETEVLKTDQLVLVDFYADWCGPCKMLAPTIEVVAEEYNGIVKVGKLNVDESPKHRGCYNGNLTCRFNRYHTILIYRSYLLIRREPGDLLIRSICRCKDRFQLQILR